MSINRILSVAAVSALAATGVASAADAPVVSGQHALYGTAPVTIAGTGVHKGDWMGSKAHLVYRDVTLAGKQTVVTTLRAPKGKRVGGLALDSPSTVGFTALDRHYGGKRRVRARVYAANSRGKAEVTGRVYAFVR